MNLKLLSRKLRAPINRWDAFNKLNKFHTKLRSIGEIVDSAINLGTKGHYRVDSVQIRSEILALAEAVKAIQPKTILEIGTCNGGTLFIWSNIAKKKVITCDFNKSKIRGDLYQRFPAPSSSCEIISLAGNSHDSDFRKQVVKSLDGDKVDFLFIDGDHTEDGVSADYNDYNDLVRPGGIIAFHDIVEKQPIPQNQVYHFWESIKKGKSTEEFIKDKQQTGYGIGIIHVK